MKIKTLRNMAFDGVFAPIGTVLEVPKTFGQATVNQGRAVAVPDETEASLMSEDGRKFLVGEQPAAEAEPTETESATKRGGRKPKPAAAAEAEPGQHAADPFD
jgi:hypothetical protein